MGVLCCCKRKSEEPLLNKDDETSKDALNTSDNPYNVKLTVDDFNQLKTLGKGSFGKVVLVSLKKNNKLYAMKILDKAKIKKRKQEAHTITERNLMVRVNNPFVVRIHSAFQDEKNLYILTEFMQGGEMFFHIQKEKIFSEEKTRFYIAELVLALEFLHKNKMIYRDLKPENIMIDANGHIKITDFGLSKIFEEQEIAKTFCGTPQYLAPEVLTQKYEYSVDWFSLGCVMYMMLMGRPPLRIPKGKRPSFEYYKNIQYPNKGYSEDAINLMKSLLQVEPTIRLGYGDKGVENIKKHPFFRSINWEKLMKRQVKPPFIPKLKNEQDLTYFDKMFTNEPPVNNDSLDLRTSVERGNYSGFTYFR